MNQSAPEPANEAPAAAAAEIQRQRWADDAQASDFKPLDAEGARRWRQAHPPLPLWRVFVTQACAAVVLVGVVALFSGGDGRLVRSVGYGAVAVLLPSYLFTRVTVRRTRTQAHAAAALVSLMTWEGVKIGLTVALLLAAPRLVTPLSWLALLAGFVVTIKASWVALWLLAMRGQSVAPRVNEE